MIQILLSRIESLDGLKLDIKKDLMVLRGGDCEDFISAANKLLSFVDVYKETLSRFIHGENKQITFEKYEGHMKKHDNELFTLCNQYSLIKNELVVSQKGDK